MNKARRDLLKQAVAALDTAEAYINSALEQEQDCLDNMPENLEYSDRYEKMETAIEQLEGAIEGIDDVRNCIEEASQ